jgi:hypothetical protein
MLLLAFLLGFLLGGWMLAGTKWKRRYREEVTRREALEREYKHGTAMDIAARARTDTATGTTTGTTTETRSVP